MGDQNIQKTFEKKWKGQLWMQYDAAILEIFRELSVQTHQVDRISYFFTRNIFIFDMVSWICVIIT